MNLKTPHNFNTKVTRMLHAKFYCLHFTQHANLWFTDYWLSSELQVHKSQCKHTKVRHLTLYFFCNKNLTNISHMYTHIYTCEPTLMYIKLAHRHKNKMCAAFHICTYTITHIYTYVPTNIFKYAPTNIYIHNYYRYINVPTHI